MTCGVMKDLDAQFGKSDAQFWHLNVFNFRRVLRLFCIIFPPTMSESVVPAEQRPGWTSRLTECDDNVLLVPTPVS